MTTREQKQQVAQQHLIEWNQHVSLEIKNQRAIEQRHRQERDQSYVNEINSHERDTLTVRHLQ